MGPEPSWNLVFDPNRIEGLDDEVEQTRFALDPRLHLEPTVKG
jgi:hypothetical protein